MDLKKLYEKTNGGLGQDHFSFTLFEIKSVEELTRKTLN
jgi:hypothetical protein